jgi:hypothetical protein
MAPELLAHLQDPGAALGGHEFGDWPPEYIANGFGGDLDARHRHDHTRYARPPVRVGCPGTGRPDSQEATPHSQRATEPIPSERLTSP